MHVSCCSKNPSEYDTGWLLHRVPPFVPPELPPPVPPELPPPPPPPWVVVCVVGSGMRSFMSFELSFSGFLSFSPVASSGSPSIDCSPPNSSMYVPVATMSSSMMVNAVSFFMLFVW